MRQSLEVDGFQIKLYESKELLAEFDFPEVQDLSGDYNFSVSGEPSLETLRTSNSGFLFFTLLALRRIGRQSLSSITDALEVLKHIVFINPFTCSFRKDPKILM